MICHFLGCNLSARAKITHRKAMSPTDLTVNFTSTKIDGELPESSVVVIKQFRFFLHDTELLRYFETCNQMEKVCFLVRVKEEVLAIWASSSQFSVSGHTFPLQGLE